MPLVAYDVTDDESMDADDVEQVLGDDEVSPTILDDSYAITFMGSTLTNVTSLPTECKNTHAFNVLLCGVK